MTAYTKTMGQALREVYLVEDNMSKMKKAAGGSAQTLKMKDGNLKMDSFTASAIMKVYDAVNDKNKKMIDGMLSGKRADIMKLQKFAMSKVNASYNMNMEEFEEEFNLFEHKGDSPHKHPHDKEETGDPDDQYDDEEERQVSEGRMKDLHGYIQDGKTAEQIAKLMKLDVKTIKSLMAGYNENLDEKKKEVVFKGTPAQIKKQMQNLKKKDKLKIGEEDDLDEGSWHIAKNMNALKKKMQKPIPKGDLMVKFVMKHIGDDELTDEMFDAKTGTDMVPMIKSAMKRLNIKEEVDLDEALTTKDWMKAVTAAGKKMGANMARKTPGKIIPFVSIDGDTTKVGYTDKEGEDHTIYTTKKKLPRAETDKMTADILKKFSEEVDEGAAADARRAISKDKDIGNRGRDSADIDAHGATDDDIKGASKNIIMQLRKAGNRASTGVEFDDKKKVKVDSKIAQAVQTKYNSLRRPAEKQEFQSKIAKSYKDLLKALKEDYLPIKETILDRIARKLMERKND